MAQLLVASGVKLGLFGKEDIRTLLSGPLDPHAAHELASYALRKRLFDEEDPLFNLVVSLGNENNPNSPHGIYQMHLRNQNVPPNPDIRPPDVDVEGVPVSLALEGLRESAKAFSVEIDQIPKNATVENWRALCEGLTARMKSSKKLRSKYEDFSVIRARVLTDPYYEQLLDFSQYKGGASVPAHKAQFAAILSWILSLDPAPSKYVVVLPLPPAEGGEVLPQLQAENGEVLPQPQAEGGEVLPQSQVENAEVLPQPQDESVKDLSEQHAALYFYGLENIECESGKRQNNSKQYIRLPNAFKYPAKGLEHEGDEAVVRAKQQALGVIHESISDFLEKDRRMYEDLFRIAGVGVHTIEYVKNSIGHLIGLGDGLIFDKFATPLRIERDQILETCLKHMTAKVFIGKLMKATENEPAEKSLREEGTFNDLIAAWIGSSSAFWDFTVFWVFNKVTEQNEESMRRTLNERGALQILRLLGVVHVRGAPVIADWEMELSFAATSAKDFHFDRSLSGTGTIAKQMQGLLDGDLKNREPEEKCQYLHTWIQKKEDIKKKLGEKVPSTQLHAFEIQWDTIVANAEKSYLGALQQVIGGKMGSADPISVLTLVENQDRLFDMLFPDTPTSIEELLSNEDKIRSMKKEWKSRIGVIMTDRINREIEGPNLLRTLKIGNAIAAVLSKETNDLFAGMIKNKDFILRRFTGFREQLAAYQVEFNSNLRFEIKPFIQFCERGAILLPPGDLTQLEGYNDVAKEIEDLIQAIEGKARAQKTHVLSLKEAKAVYDPLAERFGHAPMEIVMPVQI